MTLSVWRPAGRRGGRGEEVKEGSKNRASSSAFIFVIITFAILTVLGTLTRDLALLHRRFLIIDTARSLPLLSRWRSGGRFHGRGMVVLVPTNPRSSSSTPYARHALALLHRGDFVGGQESTAGPARSPHGVVVSRFMQVGLSTLGSEAELLFEFLTGDASLQNAVELLRVNVER